MEEIQTVSHGMLKSTKKTEENRSCTPRFFVNSHFSRVYFFYSSNRSLHFVSKSSLCQLPGSEPNVLVIDCFVGLFSSGGPKVISGGFGDPVLARVEEEEEEEGGGGRGEQGVDLYQLSRLLRPKVIK